jgi:hypothetical protein
MTTKTQINCLKAASAGDGRMVRFGTIYWKPVGYTPGGKEYIPNQISTFGTRAINSLSAMKLMQRIGEDEAVITDAGREALKGHAK